MPQLYKHNKGKWLLSTVVSKNTASNEEKWRSLRRRPVMCHWPTLSPKINHERGALWLRCGHSWSINPPLSLPSVHVSFAPPPPHPSPPKKKKKKKKQIQSCWHELNQHKWRSELMKYAAVFVLIISVSTSKVSPHLWGVDSRKCTFLGFQLSLFTKPINCTFPLIMKKGR